jgi:hypothetical protein
MAGQRLSGDIESACESLGLGKRAVNFGEVRREEAAEVILRETVLNKESISGKGQRPSLFIKVFE